jgi:5-deoxy-5-amino-3-dehydroquinate synthase
MRTVPVALGDRSYDVVVGPGARQSLADLVARCRPDARRVAVVTQPGIPVTVETGLEQSVHLVPDGESAKSLGTVEELCRAFARAGLSRSDLVVAVGGGVVTDLAGFAAATYQRGISYINVATSLLAQVDAAIGGKTGVNIPEGKNLVGAFWQPAAVVCDTDVLATLPAREWSCGRGEMAKYAFLGGVLGDNGAPNVSLLDLPIEEQVASCVAIKAAVVAADEREGDRRMLLNYGHTLAHALEAASFAPDHPVDLRHGEAVAIGLVYAAMLAEHLGRITSERVDVHRQVVGGFDLSADLPEGLDHRELLGFMARDKKAHHDLTFVLDGPAGVEVVKGVDEMAVLATLSAMADASRPGGGASPGGHS